MKRNLKFIKQEWGESILLVADNWSVHKNAAVIEFYMKIRLDVLSDQVIHQIKSIWEFVGFKWEKKLLKICLKTKQELKDKVIEIKEKIER